MITKLRQMFERISKVQAQVVACMILLIGGMGLAYLAAVNGVPKSAELLLNKVIDLGWVGVIGWLFTSNKNNQQRQNP